MSNNLIIFPEIDFLNPKSNNLFIDQFCFDCLKDKSFKNSVIKNSRNLKSQRISSYELVNKIFYKILRILRPILNDINKVNYDIKSYEILLGAWLRKFIQQSLLKFELLKEAKILFNDHEKLHEHLINVWKEPLKWWYSNNVQKNLNKFINLYTKRHDKKFNSKLKNIIKEKI